MWGGKGWVVGWQKMDSGVARDAEMSPIPRENMWGGKRWVVGWQKNGEMSTIPWKIMWGAIRWRNVLNTKGNYVGCYKIDGA